MSSIIYIDDEDFSGSGLPALTPIFAGFPLTDLQGLYLFEEGNNGEVHTGTFVDSSGLGNHATLRSGWSQPTKQSSGMVAGAGGLSLAAPFAFSESFTVVLAVDLNEALPASGAKYPFILGPVQDAPASPDLGANSAAGHGFVNTEINAAGTSLNWGIFRSGGVLQGSSTVRQLISASTGHGNSPSLVGITFDSATGFLLLKHGAGEYRASNAVLSTFDPAHNPCFGITQFSNGQQVTAGAGMLLAAFYSGSSETLLDEVMAAARTRIEARGVTPLY